MENAIQEYGYWIILIGSFIEGETALIMGVFAASSGYLGLPGVIFSAFIGALLGDQLYFYLGRRHGPAMLVKHPKWEPRVARVRRLLHRYHAPFILSVRFLYGIRTPALLAMGLSHVSICRFTALNTVSVALWAVVIGLTGFLLGEALTSLLTTVKHIQIELWGGILFATTLLLVIRFLCRRAFSKQQQEL